MGASFSLIACQPKDFSQALFLSPVVDLLALIEKMMASAGIDEQQLARDKVIATADGLVFRADYVEYLRQHSPLVWEGPLAVLIGSQDDVADYAAVRDFCRQHGGILDAVEGAEHYFHQPDELQTLREWFRQSLASV